MGGCLILPLLFGRPDFALPPDPFGFFSEDFSVDDSLPEGFSVDGLPPEGFSDLLPEGFSGLTPESFAGFVPECLSGLLPECLSGLLPEGLGLPPEGFSVAGFSVAGFSVEGFSVEGFSVELDDLLPDDFGFAGLLPPVVTGFSVEGAGSSSPPSPGPWSVDSMKFADSMDSTAVSAAVSRAFKLGLKLRTECERRSRPSVPADGRGAASAPLSSADKRMARKAIVKRTKGEERD